MDATLATLREAGTGDPVVCLHASASTGGQWRALMERLAPAWHVIAPDQFGYCRRTPQERIEGFMLADELDWLAPVLERAGGRVHLVGHSYGGLIAMLAALRWPARVRSLALYEPACWSVAVRDDPTHPGAIELDRVGASVIRGAETGALETTAADFVEYWSGQGPGRRCRRSGGRPRCASCRRSAASSSPSARSTTPAALRWRRTHASTCRCC